MNLWQPPCGSDWIPRWCPVMVVACGPEVPLAEQKSSGWLQIITAQNISTYLHVSNRNVTPLFRVKISVASSFWGPSQADLAESLSALGAAKPCAEAGPLLEDGQLHLAAPRPPSCALICLDCAFGMELLMWNCETMIRGHIHPFPVDPGPDSACGRMRDMRDQRPQSQPVSCRFQIQTSSIIKHHHAIIKPVATSNHIQTQNITKWYHMSGINKKKTASN
jgi:hypothetical protein